MAANFTVEDGTGVDGANSYTDVAYADQYFLDRGVVAWTGADSVKQSALVRATDYVTTRYTLRDDLVPALGGPAADPVITVPDKLNRAISEYALRALSAELAPDPTVDDSGQKIIGSTETIGPITETKSFTPGGTTFIFRPYPAADILLKGLVRSSGGGLIRN